MRFFSTLLDIKQFMTKLLGELKIRNFLDGFRLFIVLKARLHTFANFEITKTVLFCRTSPLAYVLLSHILRDLLFNRQQLFGVLMVKLGPVQQPVEELLPLGII